MLGKTMETARITALLEPFLGGTPLSTNLTAQLQAYLDLLLRWNVRINLTSVRRPEEIVTRHFGESLFAARVLRDSGAFASPTGLTPTLADVCSGAGFPGIPIKLFAPEVHLTLIESQNKKATFLREVIRTLGINGAEVFSDRAEEWSQLADVVTMRAAERFESALGTAAKLVAPHGHLCLLIGASQCGTAHSLAPSFGWKVERAMPLADRRTVLVGQMSK
jgi:16S rRNA (guanine527-N7)-methyltransferase